MDAEEDEEEDEDDIDGDITTQSEADQLAVSMSDLNNQSATSSKDTSQSEMAIQMDSSEMGWEESQEDKENSSGLVSSGEHSNAM